MLRLCCTDRGNHSVLYVPVFWGPAPWTGLPRIRPLFSKAVLNPGADWFRWGPLWYLRWDGSRELQVKCLLAFFWQIRSSRSVWAVWGFDRYRFLWTYRFHPSQAHRNSSHLGLLLLTFGPCHLLLFRRNCIRRLSTSEPRRESLRFHPKTSLIAVRRFVNRIHWTRRGYSSRELRIFCALGWLHGKSRGRRGSAWTRLAIGSFRRIPHSW